MSGKGRNSEYDLQSGFARGMFRFMLVMTGVLTALTAWDTISLLVNMFSEQYSLGELGEHALFALVVAEVWFISWLLVREHPERSRANWWGFRYGCREENGVSRVLDDAVVSNIASGILFVWVGMTLTVFLQTVFGFTIFGMDFEMTVLIVVKSLGVMLVGMMTVLSVLFWLRRSETDGNRLSDCGCVCGT